MYVWLSEEGTLNFNLIIYGLDRAGSEKYIKKVILLTIFLDKIFLKFFARLLKLVSNFRFTGNSLVLGIRKEPFFKFISCTVGNTLVIMKNRNDYNPYGYFTCLLCIAGVGVVAPLEEIIVLSKLGPVFLRWNVPLPLPDRANIDT